jgi:hypothetical protein
MGDVKDTVVGTPPPKKEKTKKRLIDFGKPKKARKNMVQRVEELQEELSDLVAQKDADTLNEGKASEAENRRKAALLRAASSLLSNAKDILKEYA